MEKPKRVSGGRSAPAKVLSNQTPPKAVIFNEPIQAVLPCPLNLTHHLGLDEFYLFDSRISVFKTQTNKLTRTEVRIGKACENLKRRHVSSDHSSCYTLDLSSISELDKFIHVPEIVKDHSLFHKYWPDCQDSNFFRPRSKHYHAFQGRYKSFPYLAYGGLTEWIHVLRGRLSVTVIEPTQLNLARLDCLDEGEELVIEPGTYHEYILGEDNFLSIPAGRISIKKAIRSTCALGGEMLHSGDLPNQLEIFKKDVRRTNGRYGFPNDSEIRHLYWFYSLHIMSKPSAPDERDFSHFNALIEELSDWSHKFRLAAAKADPYANPDLYAPTGIHISTIVRDFRNRLRQKKDPAEGNTSQVSDGDQTLDPTSTAPL